LRSDEIVRALRDALRREWWLVLVVLAAAVVAALFVGGGAKTSYQAQSTFVADTTLTNRYKGVPTPDDVVRDVGAAASKKAIVQAAGVSAGEASRLQLSGFGNPQNRLLVTFASPDRAAALAVVKAADAAILDYVKQRTTVERSNFQAQVDQSDATIAALEKTLADPSLTAAERAGIDYSLWQVRQARLQSQDVVDVISSVYTAQGEPTAASTSSSSALASRLAAALLAGLFVGIVLAGGREALLRRATTRP
jgi:hypothetical protein